MFDPEVFCQRVKSLRLAKGLSQEELGKHLNLSKIAVSGIERGYRSTTVEKFAKIAIFFDVSADYLLGLTDNPRRH